MARRVEFVFRWSRAQLLQNITGSIPCLSQGEGKAALANAPSLPLPDEVVTRAKTGFGVPTGAWMNAAAARAGATAQAPETKGLASRRWSNAVLDHLNLAAC
jgi:asparagine synthase (glutamine-hydrolysing)